MVTDPRTFLTLGTTYTSRGTLMPLPTLPVFRGTPSDFRFFSRNSRQSGNCTRQLFFSRNPLFSLTPPKEEGSSYRSYPTLTPTPEA